MGLGKPYKLNINKLKKQIIMNEMMTETRMWQGEDTCDMFCQVFKTLEYEYFVKVKEHNIELGAACYNYSELLLMTNDFDELGYKYEVII